MTSPSPENLKTLFEFVFKGFDALEYQVHMYVCARCIILQCKTDLCLGCTVVRLDRVGRL